MVKGRYLRCKECRRRSAPRKPLAPPALAATVGAALAAPAFPPLLDCNPGDDKGGEGVRPPEPCYGIQDEADEQRDGEVRTELSLRGLLHGRGRSKLVTDTTLHTREEWHRHGCESCQTDADPTCLRMLAAGERADGLDADVGGEDEEAQRDQLLGASLSMVPSFLLPRRRRRTVASAASLGELLSR